MDMPLEKKEDKTWAIVGTIAAILLCGCPGLALCLVGAYAATGNIPVFWNDYGNFPSWIGGALLCVAIFFIAIAVVVPILLLRKKKPAPVAPPPDVFPPQAPLPPAS
jgi:hypothetical protein